MSRGSSDNFSRRQTEVATGGVLNKVFLKVLQISQETAVLESLFNKVGGLASAFLLKRNSNTAAFL